MVRLSKHATTTPVSIRSVGCGRISRALAINSSAHVSDVSAPLKKREITSWNSRVTWLASARRLTPTVTRGIFFCDCARTILSSTPSTNRSLFSTSVAVTLLWLEMHEERMQTSSGFASLNAMSEPAKGSVQMSDARRCLSCSLSMS